MIQGRDLLQDPAVPRATATAGDRVLWLRNRIRHTARDLAVLETMALLSPERAAEELGMVADGWADKIDAGDDVIRVAVQAEREISARVVARLNDQLHRTVFGLGREHAPGPEIMAAAESLCERLGVFVPARLLFRRCQCIANQAAAPARKWRRRFG